MNETNNETVKRGKGRPFKVYTQEELDAIEAKKLRGRGRPRKELTEDAEEKIPKRRGRPSKQDQIRSLEERFNIAESLVEELDCIVDDLVPVTRSLHSNEMDNNLDIVVMDVQSLKQDFQLVRNNIIKLVGSGQRILDSASQIDIEDLKASQLDALANLQSTLGNNLKLLIDIYKDLAAIEKSRQKPVAKDNIVPENVVNGNVTNNQILFTGDSNALLKLINEQSSVRTI